MERNQAKRREIESTYGCPETDQANTMFRTPSKQSFGSMKGNSAQLTRASSTPSTPDHSSLRFTDGRFTQFANSSFFKKSEGKDLPVESVVTNNPPYLPQSEYSNQRNTSHPNKVERPSLLTPQPKQSKVSKYLGNITGRLLFESNVKENNRLESEVNNYVEKNISRTHEKPPKNQKVVEVFDIQTVEIPVDVIKENVINKHRILDVNESQVHKFPHLQRLPTELQYIHSDKICEKPIFVENIIERDVILPIHKTIEVPVEKVIKKSVTKVINRPVPIETPIFKEVEVAVENLIYKPVDIIVEKPIFIENIIELPVPVEKLVEKIVEIPVETIVEKPVMVDRPIKRQVDKIVEIPIPREKINEVHRDEIQTNKLHVDEIQIVGQEKVIKVPKFIHHVQKVEFEKVKEVIRTKKVEKTIPIHINRAIEKKLEHIFERPVYIERIVEKPVYKDKIIEVPIETIIERIVPVEKIVEKEIHYDSIIEKKVEVIVIKDVEVLVEKEVEIEVVIEIPKLVENVVNVYEDIDIELENEIAEEAKQESDIEEEFEDEFLSARIEKQKLNLDRYTEENNSLRNQRNLLELELAELKNNLFSAEFQINSDLRLKVQDLESKLKEAKFDFEISKRKKPPVVLKETMLNYDPYFDELIQKLNYLAAENADLVARTRQLSQQLYSSLPRNE